MTVRDSSSQDKYPGVWVHRKGGRYRIVDFAVSEMTMQPVVIYESLDHFLKWVRPCSEFFDGRFKWELG